MSNKSPQDSKSYILYSSTISFGIASKPVPFLNSSSTNSDFFSVTFHRLQDSDKEKLIHFGASGYGHNYSAAARKSFKARHKCDTATNKLSARYWSCKKLWAGKGGSTKSSPASKRGKY